MPLGRGKKGQDAKEKELRAELAAGLKDVDIFDPKIQNAPPSDKPWEFKPFPGRKEITDSDLFIMYYIRCMNKRIPYYYRDRCGVTRGPATIPIMKEAWINGLIDENTLVWGQGQVEYLPIKNVRYLTGQIRSPEGAHRPAP